LGQRPGRATAFGQADLDDKQRCGVGARRSPSLNERPGSLGLLTLGTRRTTLPSWPTARDDGSLSGHAFKVHSVERQRAHLRSDRWMRRLQGQQSGIQPTLIQRRSGQDPAICCRCAAVPAPPDAIACSLAPPRYSELTARQCDAWLNATLCSLDEVACSTVMASWRPSRASSRVASATRRSRRSLSSRPISTNSSTLSV
jgi:hypothetical protein